MPSPFPGMNPYLEREGIFHDFHQSIIPRLRETLAALVRPKYATTLDTHVYLHEFTAEERRLVGRHDVGIRTANSAAAAPPGSLMAFPSVMGAVPVPVMEERSTFIEVRDRKTFEVVTVVELLSPSNKKPGPDREQYLGKRGQYLKGSVHLVEIDLLRGWKRMPMEGLPSCDYCVMVSRWEQRPAAELFPIKLRDALPGIPIPLKSPDPFVVLELQPILHSLYDAACYADFLYDEPIDPPLGPNDANWAASILANR